MSYKLNKPYTDKRKADFIVLHNHQNGKRIEETETALYALEPYELLQGDTVIDNTEAYEAEQAAKEQARILELSMTRSDFFDGMIKAFGLDSDDLLTVITAILSASQMSAIEQKVAINNYKNALNFYRKHPLFTILSNVAIPITSAATITITSKQWDKFFDETKKGNENAYKYLTTVTLTINPTPSDATVTINGEETSTVTLPFGDNVEYSVAAEGYLTHLGTVELTEDTTLDVELVEEIAEEENVNSENDYSQNEGKNVNNEVDNETE